MSIAGIVFGIVVLMTIVVGGLYFICTRRMLKKKKIQQVKKLRKQKLANDNMAGVGVSNRGATMDDKPIYGVPYKNVGV